MLTRLPPVRAPLTGTDMADLYIRPGDPMAIMNMCSASARVLFQADLESFETVPVSLEGEMIGVIEELETEETCNAQRKASVRGS
jgi:hypothetical protein